MNKMVLFIIWHSRFPDITVKGLVDGDYLLDEEAQQYGEGIIQYYQGHHLRWKFPVNKFMKHSIKWNAYEEFKEFILANEKDIACTIFEGGKDKINCRYEGLFIEREVLTW